MGRKNRKKRDRDHTSISSLLAPAPPPAPRVTVSSAAHDLKQIQDRRRFSFHPEKPPAFKTGRPARVTMKAPAHVKPTRRHQPVRYSPRLIEVEAFKAPHAVGHCTRRKQRQQVLFAKKLTRRGARSRKHRNVWSTVYCR